MPTRSKSRDPKVTDETKKSEVAAAIPVAAEEPHKKTEKSRSQSRKRASIFGSLLGKKEEHDEKKEVKAEEKATDKEVKKEVMPTKDDTVENKVENQVEKGVNKPDAIQPAPLNAAAVGTSFFSTVDFTLLTSCESAARVVDEPIVPAESSKLHGDEEVTGTTAGDPVPETAPKQPETAPKPSKRNSVFGGLFNKKDVTNPPAEPVEKGAPAVPAKDNETVPVSKDAPQLDTPVDTTSPAEAATAPEATKSATSPISTNPSEQKGGIFGFMKQKEVQHDVRTSMILWIISDKLTDKRRKRRISIKRSKWRRRLTFLLLLLQLRLLWILLVMPQPRELRHPQRLIWPKINDAHRSLVPSARRSNESQMVCLIRKALTVKARNLDQTKLVAFSARPAALPEAQCPENPLRQRTLPRRQLAKTCPRAMASMVTRLRLRRLKRSLRVLHLQLKPLQTICLMTCYRKQTRARPLPSKQVPKSSTLFGKSCAAV